MGFVARNDMKTKLNAIVFDRYTCERSTGSKTSPLIAIYEGLERRGGFNLMWFDPSAFDPEKKELPYLPLKSEKQEPKMFEPNVIFTFGFNFFNVQEYYSESRHKADIVTVDFGFLKRDMGYRYVVKNNTLPKTTNNARFRQLGLSIEDKRKADGHILVAEQNHHREWYSKAMMLVSEHTNKPIKIRQPSEKVPLEDDIAAASALVTYNSTCLYQALLNRIPVFCSEECIAADVAETDLTKIDSAEIPSVQKVQHFLNRLSYAQWRIDELKIGIWIPHYFEGY
jgi:hypothetical protein